MKRDGKGGTKFAVKICCEEENTLFEKGAYVAIFDGSLYCNVSTLAIIDSGSPHTAATANASNYLQEPYLATASHLRRTCQQRMLVGWPFVCTFVKRPSSKIAGLYYL